MALGDGKAKKEVEGVNQELGFILDAVTSIGDQLVKSFEDAVDNASNLNGAVDVVGKTMQRGLVADLKKAVQNTDDLIGLQAKVNLGTATQRDIAKEAEKIAINEAKLSAKREVLGDRLTDTQKELLAQEQEQLDFQKKVLKAIEDENTELQKQKSFFQVVKESTGGIADKIDKTGTLSKILSGKWKDVLTVTRLAELSVLGIFHAAVEVDESTGKLAKNLNISYNEASSLQSELNQAANSSSELSITTKGLGEALMAINGELGIFNTTIDENLISFEKLHKTAGLTYNELSGINSISIATGTNLEDNTKEVMAQARLTGQRYKVALNEKDILKDISKVSAATTLSLGKNPGQIAAAVSTAKALGLEMSKVEGIAGSLIDFESSIENELSAELLLNKDLNLEKARQAALNNDLATVASEIAKQAGSAAEFAEMNRIQQDALAKSVGMSREELAKTLFTQEQIGNLSGDEYELRKKQIDELEAKGLSQAQIKEELGKKSLDDLKNQNSVQEKLTQSVDKMKELFVSIAGPIMQIVSPIVDILVPAIGGLMNLLTPIVAAFQGVADIINSLIDPTKTLGDTLAAMGPVTAFIASALAAAGVAVLGSLVPGLIRAGIAAAAQLPALISGAIAAVTSASAVTLGIGAVAIIAGIAGVIAAMNSATSNVKKAGDVISPAKGKTQISTKEGGLFELSPNDDLIAAPGASARMKNGGGSNNTVIQQDNTETNNLLKQLISTNQEGNYLQRKKPELSPVGLYEVQ